MLWIYQKRMTCIDMEVLVFILKYCGIPSPTFFSNENSRKIYCILIMRFRFNKEKRIGILQ